MQSSRAPSTTRRPKLKTQFERACRRKGYPIATERTYWRWIVRFIRLHGVQHPSQMSGPEIRCFLLDPVRCARSAAPHALRASLHVNSVSAHP
ncbi:MAG: hypothetical protein GVY36_10845 [Verrucomicrobia bacterium]|nr:hypothetical protein [Verrucomicrobiota bacterium]